MDKKYYVYIIETEKNTLYCGYTDDVKKRYQKHVDGTGAKYTKAFKPKELVYVAEFATKQDATKEEYRIKHLLRKEKDALIQEYSKKLQS
ncbi:MAG: GIY-YIG nuclease family protein [Candidatus Gastranaerophilales bacterium]|nr:GIY-YIG nuclease family protein [Candidatus Gastranaerophilales bacterium]